MMHNAAPVSYSPGLNWCIMTTNVTFKRHPSLKGQPRLKVLLGAVSVYILTLQECVNPVGLARWVKAALVHHGDKGHSTLKDYSASNGLRTA